MAQTIMGIDPGPVVSGVVIIEVKEFDTRIIWTSREGPAWEDAPTDGRVIPVATTPSVRKEGTILNEHLRANIAIDAAAHEVNAIVFEGIEHRGKVVGKATFQTLVWIGIFSEVVRNFYNICPTWKTEIHARFPVIPSIKILFPYQIRRMITGSVSSKKGEIKSALIERFGEIGKKDNPGLFYPLAKPKLCQHLFSAFATAQAYADLPFEEKEKIPSPENFLR